MSNLATGVNFIGFQAGWFFCVLGAANGYPYLGPVFVVLFLALHLHRSPSGKSELQFVLLVALLGLLVDSLFKATSVLKYASPVPQIWWIAPIWIVAIWALFASSLNSSMRWLRGKGLLSFLFGAVLGPLSYLAGERLGAVCLGTNRVLSIIVLSGVWGVLMPTLMRLSEKMIVEQNTQ